MRTIKKSFKRGTAILLSCAMIAGMVNVMPDNAVHVQAAGSEPGMSAYATKEQLMDSTFAPKADGTADNIGKLIFGKNNDGAPQEWYILGEDSSVSGDNTVIVAVSRIKKQVIKFGTSALAKDESRRSDCSYPAGTTITEVRPSHYGASIAREELKRIAVDENFFTTTEQGLLNATTVTTYDGKNNVNYTTTDKLYLPQADNSDTSIACAGSNDDKKLLMGVYDNSYAYFLRTPGGTGGKSVYAYKQQPAEEIGVLGAAEDSFLRPASNLKLSSVLFASAATAATTMEPVSGVIPSK